MKLNFIDIYYHFIQKINIANIIIINNIRFDQLKIDCKKFFKIFFETFFIVLRNIKISILFIISKYVKVYYIKIIN